MPDEEQQEQGPEFQVIGPPQQEQTPQPNQWVAPPGYASGPNAPTGPTVIDRIIPTQNPPALFAYYCGLFGLIPCIGLPLSIAGIVLGIIGIRKVKQTPQLPGWGHGLSGVIMGSIGTLYNLPLFVVIVYAIIASATRSQ